MFVGAPSGGRWTPVLPQRGTRGPRGGVAPPGRQRRGWVDALEDEQTPTRARVHEQLEGPRAGKRERRRIADRLCWEGRHHAFMNPLMVVAARVDPLQRRREHAQKQQGREERPGFETESTLAVERRGGVAPLVHGGSMGRHGERLSRVTSVTSPSSGGALDLARRGPLGSRHGQAWSSSSFSVLPRTGSRAVSRGMRRRRQ